MALEPLDVTVTTWGAVTPAGTRQVAAVALGLAAVAVVRLGRGVDLAVRRAVVDVVAGPRVVVDARGVDVVVGVVAVAGVGRADEV